MWKVRNKMKDWLAHLGLAALAALAPIKPILITTGVLIVTDLLFGVWAAKKRGEEITSAGLRRTVTKFLVYQLCVISGFLVEKYMLGDILPVVKLISGVIGIVEIKSILESTKDISGVDIFSEVIKKLGSDNDKEDKKT